jgi:hypothetical protein
MHKHLGQKRVEAKIYLAALLIVLTLFAAITTQTKTAFALPAGATIVSNTTDLPTSSAASSLTTAGGSFTTLVINGTYQNARWKAYVGNISGVLTLDDSSNYTIYDWNITSINGEVFVTRNSTISWSSVNCTTSQKIGAEDQFLSINGTSVDSINRTFNATAHRSFYVGTNRIINSTCKSIATYVNDTRQSASESAAFQEVLLTDTYTNVIYATLINDNSLGYNNGKYDFQMIVPEDDTKQTPTTYYFYAEIS